MPPATIAQVHRARMADGQPVVVKVQRPEAEQVVENDLAHAGDDRRAGGALAAAEPGHRRALAGRTGLGGLRDELDFGQEARNTVRMAEIVAGYARVCVPRVHRELSTRRLLVMDEVVGAVPLLDAPARARAHRGRPAADPGLLQAGARGWLLSRRPSPGQHALGRWQDLAPRPRHGRASRRPDAAPALPRHARLRAGGRRLARRRLARPERDRRLRRGRPRRLSRRHRRRWSPRCAAGRCRSSTWSSCSTG